jgi:hypothetical protein
MLEYKKKNGLGSWQLFHHPEKKQVGLQRPNTAYLRAPSFFLMLTLPLQTELVSIKNSWIKIKKSRALSKIKKNREITEALTNFYWLKVYPFLNPLLRHMRAINFLEDNEPRVW